MVENNLKKGYILINRNCSTKIIDYSGSCTRRSIFLLQLGRLTKGARAFFIAQTLKLMGSVQTSTIKNRDQNYASEGCFRFADFYRHNPMVKSLASFLKVLRQHGATPTRLKALAAETESFSFLNPFLLRTALPVGSC